MGGRSEYENYVAGLVSQGMDEGQARQAATKQYYLYNVAKAGLGGAVTGGVMAGGANIIGSIGNKNAQAPNKPVLPPIAGGRLSSRCKMSKKSPPKGRRHPDIQLSGMLVLTAIYSDGKGTFFDLNNIYRKDIKEAPPERYTAQDGFTQTGSASLNPRVAQAAPEVNTEDMVPSAGSGMDSQIYNLDMKKALPWTVRGADKAVVPPVSHQ